MAILSSIEASCTFFLAYSVADQNSFSTAHHISTLVSTVPSRLIEYTYRHILLILLQPCAHQRAHDGNSRKRHRVHQRARLLLRSLLLGALDGGAKPSLL